MAILRKGAKSQTLQWASEWDGELLVFFLHQHFIFILSNFFLYLYQTQHVRRWTQASATQVFLHQHFILIVSISFIFIKLFSEWEGEHELQLLEFFLFTSTTFALFMEFAQPAISLYAIVVIFRVKHDMNSMALIPFFNVPFQASRLSGPSRQEFRS